MHKGRAVITGISGQDGAYLTEQLLNEGFEVFGVAKSLSDPGRLSKLGLLGSNDLHLSSWSLESPDLVDDFIKEVQPNELYNLASNSSVVESGRAPYSTAMVTGVATVNLLQSVSKFSPKTRFFQAGSSELFGDAKSFPQNESSYFAPRSLYGAAKLFSYWAAEDYKARHNLFISNGILYNHESPLRSPEFVTRKISQSVAMIACGKQKIVELGNLSATRDWGYAPEYVQGMTQTLRHPAPENFVFASGFSTTVRDFVTWSFASAGIEVLFEGQGTEETGFEKSSGRQLVVVNPLYFRNQESVALVGDASKAHEILGWKAGKSPRGIAELMVQHDLEAEKAQGA